MRALGLEYYKMWQHWQGIIPSLLSGMPPLSQVMGLSIVVRTSCLSHLGWQLIASLQWKWLRLRKKEAMASVAARRH